MAARFIWYQKATLVAQLRLKWKDADGKGHVYRGAKEGAPAESGLDLIQQCKIPDGTTGVIVSAACVGATMPDDCPVTFDVVMGGCIVEYGLFGTASHKWIEFLTD